MAQRRGLVPRAHGAPGEQRPLLLLAVAGGPRHRGVAPEGRAARRGEPPRGRLQHVPREQPQHRGQDRVPQPGRARHLRRGVALAPRGRRPQRRGRRADPRHAQPRHHAHDRGALPEDPGRVPGVRSGRVHRVRPSRLADAVPHCLLPRRHPARQRRQRALRPGLRRRRRDEPGRRVHRGRRVQGGALLQRLVHGELLQRREPQPAAARRASRSAGAQQPADRCAAAHRGPSASRSARAQRAGDRDAARVHAVRLLRAAGRDAQRRG